jgi:hypothetical protein
MLVTLNLRHGGVFRDVYCYCMTFWARHSISDPLYVLIASKKHIFSQKMTSLIDLFIIGFQILVKQAEKVRMSVVNCQTHIITDTKKLK